MTNINFSGIDIGKMEVFVAIAKYENITKASESLCMTQPVVSKKIQSLEESLGLQLFLRSSGGVKLTPSGKALYAAWSKILDDITESINIASTCYEGYVSSLVIGYCNSTIPRDIALRFSKIRSEAIYFKHLKYTDLIAKLCSEEVDLGFYAAFPQMDITPPLKYKVIGSNPVCACMLPTNPLAGKSVISVDDVKAQNMIMLSPLTSPAWIASINLMCAQQKFIPKVAMHVDDVDTMFMNLLREDQVIIADYNVMHNNRFDVVVRPVEGISVGSMFIWNENNESAALFDMIRCGEEFLSTIGFPADKQT